MTGTRTATVAVLVGLAAVGRSQYSGWQPGQVNASMCMWSQPRAAVLHDTVYIDGGYLYWSRGMNDGSTLSPDWDGNPLGLMYTLNFSQPFNSSVNFTSLFKTSSKALGGPGSAAANIAPNYFDGAMLANDHEFFLYGGLLRRTAAFPEPYPDQILGYQAYQYGVDKPAWRPGFVDGRLPTGLTRFVAYGGAANAPSENKAFYFGGLRSPSGANIYEVSTNESTNAVNVSSTLVTLDLTIQQNEKWSNESLPDFIQGRANPEVVWVPVGAQGILVVLGGVVLPEFAYATKRSPNPVLSTQQSNEFMTTIDVYDVATKTWYRQPTSGAGPAALTRGCAVLGTAKDYSSFNIYYYGGYDGLDRTSSFNDDVWVLSLPSFTWTRLRPGSDFHARAGQKCFTPYPDQMMVIGGYTPQAGTSLSCVEEGTFLTVFNMTSGEWMDGYDPTKHADYGVPVAIQQKIGGGFAGGATATAPSPTGWATAGLGSVFATAYPTAKLTTYYPYDAVVPTGRPGSGDLPPPTSNGGGGLPNWVAPVLGVILGLVLISSIIVGCFLWRRRKMLRKAPHSEAGTEDNGMRILSWIRGQQSDTKAMTVSTEETAPTTPGLPDMSETSSPVHSIAVARPPASYHEMDNTQIAELMDTSPQPELADTGLSPVEIINKHSHFAPGGVARSVTNPSYNSHSNYSIGDQTSLVSRSSGAIGSGRSSTRPDSPPLGRSLSQAGSELEGDGPPSPPMPSRSHMVSGVSQLSEREVGHLRQISEATVSSQGSSAVGQTIPEDRELQPEPRATQMTDAAVAGPSTSVPPTPGSYASPVSPPSASDAPGTDYLTSRPAPTSPTATGSPTSPLRRSVFYENEADLGDRRL